MPDVRLPDGTIIRNVPEGTTRSQLMARVGKAQQPQRSWADVPGEALTNAPRSLYNFASGIVDTVAHPIKSAGAALDLAAGAAYNAMPEPVRNLVNRLETNPAARDRAMKTASAAGSYFKGRYGSESGFKNAIATDPVGVASDISTLLSGGSTLAANAPKLAKISSALAPVGKIARAADALSTASSITNPARIVANAAKASTRVARPIGGAIADVIGGIGTHTGGTPLRQAASAGLRGGQAQRNFTANMRGQVPMTDVLDAAKENLANMQRAKSDAYRANMSAVAGDNAVLSFDGIDQAVGKANNMAKFKGQVKNKRAAQAVDDVSQEIEAWRQLDPAEYHTPEGLDALKQRIGGILESIPFEEKTARNAVGGIYSSIKSEITKQAPSYAKAMGDYSDASDLIKEIERSMSLGQKASADTSMRKLQSIMRNNVNTNYGNRGDLARQLVESGGNDIMPALAGQALNTWTPRGLGNAVAGGIGLGGYALGGVPVAAASLAGQSPRLMGEAALKAGQGARYAGNAVNAVTNPNSNLAEVLNYMANYNRATEGQR